MGTVIDLGTVELNGSDGDNERTAMTKVKQLHDGTVNGTGFVQVSAGIGSVTPTIPAASIAPGTADIDITGNAATADWAPGGRFLSTDPLLVPFPAGTAGETAYYQRGVGVYPYLYDGRCWNPRYGDPYILPEKFTSPAPAFFIYASDLDGDRTYNSRYVDGQQVGFVANQCGLLTPCAPVTGNSANVNPTLDLIATNGQSALSFDDNAKYLTITGSKTSLAPMIANGVFDFVFVCTFLKGWSSGADSITLFGNSDSGGESGGAIFLSNQNAISIEITSASGLIVFLTTTIIMPLNQTVILRIRGDGTNVYISMNGGTEQSGAMNASNFATVANLTRDFTIGAMWDAGSPSKHMCGEFNLAYGAVTAFTAAQWYSTLVLLNGVFHVF